MNIKPIIRTKADYRAALKEIESLMSARANTPEGEHLDVLVALVTAYERKLDEEFDQMRAELGQAFADTPEKSVDALVDEVVHGVRAQAKKE